MKLALQSTLITALTIGLLTPMTVSADVWQERELLERWIAQTESLTEILDQAEYSADEQRRSKMNYGLLKKEINSTVVKVKHYLNAPAIPFDEYQAELKRMEEAKKMEEVEE